MSGIRTHEANATDLKSVPFDRSGILVESVYCFKIIISLFVFELLLVNFFDASSGIRTHEAEATDLKSVPFDRSGIDAENKPTIDTSAAYFNNACFSSQAPVFCLRRLPSPSSLPLLPRLRPARF